MFRGALTPPERMAMRDPRRLFARIVFLFAVAAMGPVALSGARRGSGSPTEPDIMTAVKSYTTWARVTRSPYWVSPAISALCASPGGGKANPHASPYINVYVNETGRTAMLKPGAVTFPEGSVIVKEKGNGEQAAEPELLTVMVKRARGYNPAVGDWEFAVVDGTVTSVQARGKLANCMECHKTVSSSDYVFRTYLTGQK
jgi:hypothetical protein